MDMKTKHTHSELGKGTKIVPFSNTFRNIPKAIEARMHSACLWERTWKPVDQSAVLAHLTGNSNWGLVALCSKEFRRQNCSWLRVGIYCVCVPL